MLKMYQLTTVKNAAPATEPMTAAAICPLDILLFFCSFQIDGTVVGMYVWATGVSVGLKVGALVGLNAGV